MLPLDTQLVNLPEILVLEHTRLHSVEILPDEIRMLRFRNNGSSAGHTPDEGDLGGGTVAFMRDLGDQGVLQERGFVVVSAGGVSGVRAREGGVSGDVDAVFAVQGQEGGLGEVRVEFHLVDGGRVGGMV